MIDHMSFSVKDFSSSVTFYDQMLAELGYKLGWIPGRCRE